MIDLAWTINDVGMGRKFLQLGSKVRDSVTAAMFDAVRTIEERAKNLAPRRDHGRIARGIGTWVEGDPAPAFQRGGLSNDERQSILTAIADKRNVTGVVFSEWYLGRFYEFGVHVKKTPFAGGRKRAGRYFGREMRRLEKQRPDMAAAERRSIAYRYSEKMRAKKMWKERWYNVQKRPFLHPAVEEMRSAFPEMMQRAVQRGMDDA